MTDARRSLPAVGTLLAMPGIQDLTEHAPRALVTEAIRAVVDRVRLDQLAAPANTDGWLEVIREELTRREQYSLRPVFNVTGVILHTNLGRAPLARQALEAITRTAAGASNLEYDLDEGTRGSRYVHCASLLRELTGAEDALVVNNGAAALVLALNTLAEGLESIVSRGELIEIGGSFRVPEIMAKSGSILREVGTTNRTHVEDYRHAIGSQTGAIVKVHRSNFEVRGFVAEASVRDLAPIARDANVPLVMDLGSGLLLSLEPYGLRGEPTVAEAVADGSTLVIMSGDKLLGGPQAGILVGSRQAVDACRRNPLTRAMRVDKLTLAALEATLALYRDPARAFVGVPVLAMVTAPAESIRERADRLAAILRDHGLPCDVVASEAAVGGGAFPTARLASSAVALRGKSADLELKLRKAAQPIIGRIVDERIQLDLRSLLPDRDEDLANAALQALAE
ncbi:MAG TPA: L-seryl-tRNA(Sec) selenium transferase [Gemmatimonadaceae bacterium]|nr:L-seryl-tRNA(Sec) selenium transferase [Gemmatimonadaceae bacterium]